MIWLMLILLSPIECSDSPYSTTYGKYKLIRLKPTDDNQLDALFKLANNASFYQLDFWKEPSHVDSLVDVMVHNDSFYKVKNYFNDNHLSFNVTLEDVQKFIESQQKNSIKFSSRRYKDDSSISRFNLGVYNSYPDIERFLDNLQQTYPNIVQVFSIGKTHEQRQLKVIKIGKPTGISKKSIWIDAGIHAREWIAPSTALYFINQLVTKYNSNAQIRQYVDDLDFYIMPVLNVDGYEYSRSNADPKVRLWRKNRSPAACKTTTWGQDCCQGVDLNRNFDFHWGENGASNNPCDEMYAGKWAFSEPETRAIQEFLQPRSGIFHGFITLHSYSQIWMYPYGHEKRNYPNDVTELHSVALKAKKAIQSVFGTKYIVGTGADTLYPASGGSDDWAKQQLNIKYSYLIELRPQENAFGGFLLDETQILPTAQETFEGIKIVADVISGNKPSVIMPVVSPSTVVEECKNTEPQCGWWASLGACQTWTDMDKRCPLSCRFCDQQ